MKAWMNWAVMPLLLGGTPELPEDSRSETVAARWNVTLRDGSRIAGVPHLETLDLHGTLIAEARLRPSEVLALHVDASRETVTVHGTRGDQVTGAVVNPSFVLETGLGRFEVPFGEVNSIGRGEFLVSAGSAINRLGETRDGFLPDDVLVDFEHDPEGRRLSVGANLAQTFEAWGLHIATSVETSFPAVDAFTVASKSRGNSCATQSPRWNGTLTLSFHRPGAPEQPAAVTRVGLCVAAVAPNGTWLRAFDADDRLIAEVATTRNGTEFLSLRTDRPIAKVQVVPDPAIDSNYTIDDVVFDSPRCARTLGGEPLYRVSFTTGDVIAARSIESDGENVVLSGLGFRSKKLRVSKKDVIGIEFPASAEKSSD